MLRSKTTTECDSRRSSRAATSPAAPAPITATWRELIGLQEGAIFVGLEIVGLQSSEGAIIIS